MGQAISGKGFFYLDFEEGGEEEGEASNAAVLSFDGLPLSARDPEAELHHFIGIDWDWKVTQVAAKEYMVLFPSQDCLRMSARSVKLFFPLSNSTAKIKLADTDPAPAELLQEVWVTISGLPRRMWRAKILTKGMRMLGRPVEVDLSSLARRTPVTIQIACRNPSKIHGLVQVFHKNGRFNVGIRVEQPLCAPTGPLRNDDDDSMGDEDDSDSLGNEEEWRRLGENEKGKNAAAAEPESEGNRTEPKPADQVAPADSVMTCDPVLDQYGNNLPSSSGVWPLPLAVLEKQRAFETPPTTTPAQQQLAILEGVPTLPPFDCSTLVTVESDYDSDASEESPGRLIGARSVEAGLGGAAALSGEWDLQVFREATMDAATTVVPRRRRTKTVPTGPARKSARLQGPAAAVSVMQRAQNRTASKNLDHAGTSTPLAHLPDAHLSSVA
jgi:hypothetical protein